MMKLFEENERMKAALEELRRNCRLREDCSGCPCSITGGCDISFGTDDSAPLDWKFKWDKED